MKGPETLPEFDGMIATGRQIPGPKEKRTRGPLVAALCLWTAWLFATPFCYGQCPLHLPPKCQSFANEVEALQAERNDLQSELKQAAGSQKGAIGSQIKNL